ncbi:hypothetical protein LAY57_04320 [Argonema antarcticum A004/B2]|nr:hypothetical protein [Argonema antarcticum A004/B2]
MANIIIQVDEEIKTAFEEANPKILNWQKSREYFYITHLCTIYAKF